ncbi:MAG: superfamily protein [Nocardioides sp.]|nr:superfamily protein [Nocardioides sp.]
MAWLVRLGGVIVFLAALSTWVAVMGMPKQTALVVGWIWLAVIAWDVRRPWREHLSFLLDWWIPLALLTVYCLPLQPWTLRGPGVRRRPRHRADSHRQVALRGHPPHGVAASSPVWCPVRALAAAAVVRRSTDHRLLLALRGRPRNRRRPVGSQPDSMDPLHASICLVVSLRARRLRSLPHGAALDGCPGWLHLAGGPSDHRAWLVRPRSVPRFRRGSRADLCCRQPSGGDAVLARSAGPVRGCLRTKAPAYTMALDAAALSAHHVVHAGLLRRALRRGRPCRIRSCCPRHVRMGPVGSTSAAPRRRSASRRYAAAVPTGVHDELNRSFCVGWVQHANDERDHRSRSRHQRQDGARNDVSNIFTKLQVPDRSAAIVKAREASLARES